MNAEDPRDVLTRTAALPDVVVRYDARADALIDLHVPPGDGPHPLVVLVHGGFWKQEYDRVHIRPMARALVDAGCVVAAMEYRRVGPPGAGGGWPTTGQDVEAAVTALPGLLDGLGIETTTTTLTGHSAGGHLVLWLAAKGGLEKLDHHRLDHQRGGRVVALAPVTDLHAAAADRLGDGATQGLLGGEPDEVPELYAAADPMTLLSSDTRSRILLVHGTGDAVVPVSQSRSLAAAYPQIELRDLDGVGHLELIDPLSPAWPMVLDALTVDRAGVPTRG